MGSAKQVKWEDPTADLAAVTSTGAGTWVAAGSHDCVRGIVAASSVTTGGTVLLEGNTKADGSGDTFTVATLSVSADGTTRDESSKVDDTFAAYRTNLSARTDGTYSTSIQILR